MLLLSDDSAGVPGGASADEDGGASGDGDDRERGRRSDGGVSPVEAVATDLDDDWRVLSTAVGLRADGGRSNRHCDQRDREPPAERVRAMHAPEPALGGLRIA
jgi:hypothetical protein